MERRIGFLFGVFAILLGIAGLRALQLATVSSHKLVAASATQQNQTDILPARRGAIVDRNGVPLAVSAPADDVSVTPYLVKNPARVAPRIATALGLPEAQVLKSLVRRDTGFVYLARNVPSSRAQKLKSIPGIDLAPKMRREYPRNWTATQVVGSTNADGKGLFGLEYLRNGILEGQDGYSFRVPDLPPPPRLRSLGEAADEDDDPPEAALEPLAPLAGDGDDAGAVALGRSARRLQRGARHRHGSGRGSCAGRSGPGRQAGGARARRCGGRVPGSQR